MRVKLTTDRVDRGAVQYEGQEIDLPEPDAQRLIRARQAEPMPAKPQGKPAQKR